MKTRMWRGAADRSLEILRREGARALWFRALGKTIYRRMILFERPLDEPIPAITPAIPVTISLLKMSEIDEYLPLRPGQDAGEILERLKKGHKCFVLRSSNAIAHACWAGIGTARMEYLNCEVRLAETVAYVYGSYTAYRFRRLNLATLRSTEMARHFRELGFRRLISAVVPENKAAFGPVLKAGYRRCGVIRSVKIGAWRYDSCRMTGDPALWILKEPRSHSLESV